MQENHVRERRQAYYEFLDSFISKFSYIACVGFICVLIAHNHNTHTEKYIEILQSLILVGVPSPLFKKVAN